MISPHGQLRIYVATRPVDFRKGIDGLALAVQEVMGLDPFSGAAFVFRAKRADRIKVLIWDQTGMVLVHKRLEGAKFVWPPCSAPSGRTGGPGRGDPDVARPVRGAVRGDRLAPGPPRGRSASGAGGLTAT
ncbi:IS66 family insertion sequence element accessory protein TnpB [Roseivivax sediminis]|uniref:IS66 Orf2 like protein n=1 Tax=Roseivivax sediminis TaxID=936889 RepID=A0A1I2EN41_9RHOB|nr:IS66 family insertion sequence element accessory protein TnpB [Roseivivax sediminis]SFE93868.1 IS66 Orf2 like protein [Roseivivax sediminis]